MAKKTLQQIASTAEALKIYNVQSEHEGILYIYADGEWAIWTPRGMLRLPEGYMKAIANELPKIMNDVDDLRRMKTQR